MIKQVLVIAFVFVSLTTVNAKDKLNTRDAKRHAYLIEKVEKEKKFDVVMLGDSITHLLDIPEQLHPNWRKQSGKNNAYLKKKFRRKDILIAGISGETTAQLLSRLQHGLAKAKSEYTVIMIGTNDARSPVTVEQVADNIKEMIKLIKKKNPRTKILLYAIFPRGGTPAKDSANQKNEKVNEILATFPKKFRRLKFININKDFLDKKGNLSRTIMYDLLHPSLEGYKVWIKSLKSIIK